VLTQKTIAKPVENVFDELYRRVYITARSSFFAARRLEIHYKWSQWTIALASIALLYIPLVQTFDLELTVNPKTLNVLEVSFAVIVLVFSLLIGTENYLLKADRMQRRGLELASIYYALEPYRKKEEDNKLYENFCANYDKVLEKYDNHLPIDFLEFTLSKKNDYYEGGRGYLTALINFQFQRFLSIAPYLLLLLPCFYLVRLLIFPT
jgi:hypothetical protein